jgi:hypothetical protein
MIGVFIPYLASGATWDELRYSLRSLEKNLQQEFTVYLVGDKPDWITNVIHLPHTREEGVVDTATYDANRKLKLFIDQPDAPDYFIRMNDDIYLLQPVNSIDLEVTRYIRTYGELKSGMLSGGENWKKAVMRSVMAVREKGYKGYMTESHCPEFINRALMKAVYEMYAPIENRLLTSTLYFNTFPHSTYINDKKTERALFYGVESEYSYSSTNVVEKIAGKRYLNHNDVGLNDELKKVISTLFPEKSKFEK